MGMVGVARALVAASPLLTVSRVRLHVVFFFFFSSRRRHTRCSRDWSSDVCSSDLGSSFASWLFAIAANRVRTRRGRASAREALARQAADEARIAAADDPAGQAVARMEGEEVRRAVSRLAWPLRVVVELYYFAGLSGEDPSAAPRLG